MTDMTYQPAAAVASHDIDPVDDKSRSYVLVVDDEAVVRDFLTRCLTDFGHSVKAVATAAEALETMVASPATAVLCDIKMPGHDGLWLASRLRQHWPSTAGVMATGLDDLDTGRRSRELGAVEYLTKPITPHQLQQVVERVLHAAVPGAAAAASASTERGADPAPDDRHSARERVDAEYTLESPVKCPACGERVTS